MKKTLDQLETKVLNWLKPLPHLPTNVTKWIAENAWWIAIIGVFASVIGCIVVIMAIITAFAFFGLSVGISHYYYASSVYTGWSLFILIVSLAFMLLMTVFIAKAISSLKKMQKTGWEALFTLQVITAIYIVISAVLSFDFMELLSGAVGVFIGAYFLFEIRSYFVKLAQKNTAK